jgi:hypothetical protein
MGVASVASLNGRTTKTPCSQQSKSRLMLRTQSSDWSLKNTLPRKNYHCGASAAGRKKDDAFMLARS